MRSNRLAREHTHERGQNRLGVGIDRGLGQARGVAHAHFIVVALSATTLVGLALCLFFATLVHGSHFPTGLVLIMSVVSAVLVVLFYALMELLLPQ